MMAAMATKTLPRIHCFRPGRHTAMSGAALSFSESDLAASAAAYDPAKYQAPIVVGHPTLDAPAYGWIDSVTAEADGLYVSAVDVDAEFADMVRERRFPNRSASFFPPNHPRNPVPGVYYLKHVGVLGAAAPAVRGLKPVEFVDDADCVTLEFGYDDTVNASMWRRLRDWIIGKHGLEEADQAIPGWEVQSLEEAATAMPARDQTGLTNMSGLSTDLTGSKDLSGLPSYAQGDSMSPEEKARLDALEAENARLKAEADALKTQSAEFADREAALQAKEAAAHQAEIADFADVLVKAGKVLPRDKAGLVAYLAGADESGAIEFADGDTTVKKPANEWLRNFLSALPAQVDFAERGAGDASFADAADPVAVAARAVEYQQSERAAGRQVNAAQAVAHVSRNSAQT